jgi:hypothetical protein
VTLRILARLQVNSVMLFRTCRMRQINSVVTIRQHRH